MASGSTLPPIPENIVFLTGPALLGIMLNWCLLGILIVQVYMYYLRFHNDKKWLKILVYTLFFLEIIQTALTTADAFHWFAYGFGNMKILATTFISPVDAPIMNSLIAYIVQLFFGWRLWVLSKSRILCILIVLIGGVQLGGGLAGGIVVLKNDDLPGIMPILPIWLVSGALVDIIIAVAMSHRLLRARKDVGFNQSTNDIILRLVCLTIETNAVSAGVAIITVVTFILSPKSNLSFCPSYVLGKIYTNTMMVSLNNRIFLSQRGASIVIGSNLNGFVIDSGEGTTTNSEPKGDSHRLDVHEGTTIIADIPPNNLEVK